MTRKFLFALVLFLLVGCQKDTIEWTDENRPNPDGSVRFRLEMDDAELKTDEVQSKATPHDSLEKYDTVCVNVFSHTSDYEVTGDDVKFYREIVLKQETPDWKCIPSLFWPVGEKLSFMAYASDIPLTNAGISFSFSEGVADSIIYKVPTEVIHQPDLLVSTKYNQPQVNNVSLTMKHALSCVSFCGIAPEEGTYVKSITLRNVYGEGSLALNDSTITWKVNKDSKGITVFEPGINEDQELEKDSLPNNNYLMTSDGYLMMIPQTLTNAAIDVLYWNGKDEKGDKVISYILPVNDPSYATWKPGLKYIYKFGSQSDGDITVVYYEKYANNEYGLYYYDKVTERNTLVNDKEIKEAGYGVVTKKSIGGPVAHIRLTTSSSTPVTSGTEVELKDMGFFLYPVSQSGGSTFTLPISSIPVDVYFNGSTKSCGTIVPHFAKGVYTEKMPTTTHVIRTPQQMRNITALGQSSLRKYHTYTQELNLDFSKTSIGGEELTTSVVDCEFNDVFEGKGKRIENVTINATKTNGALFFSNNGEIKEVLLLNSSISSSGNVGGIAATNQSEGVILYPRIMGEESKELKIQGTSGYVGAITGLNYGQITGNTAIEVATELPVAEVSGWVSLKGVSQPVGGIVGENRGTITTCLVNGVYVTGDQEGNVIAAKITIEGGDYVGGIVGVNREKVEGNFSGSEFDIKAEPDLAGIVAISGNRWVGGIAGENKGELNQVNLRLGRGDANLAMTITGSESVGGIVGFNNGGTLKADGNSNSFISVRGNVIISGTKNVGGIVGNNESGNISNCFVYNFYSQRGDLIHYAPKITGGTNVGGIVGYAGAGVIKQCAVFSTVSAINGAGDNVTNAMVKIKATGSSVGGIVGHGFRGLTITESFVLGNVEIDGTVNSGGVVGENEIGTFITSIHIGNSGSEVSDIYTKLFYKVKLPVDDYRMKTGGGVMDNTSGVPTIVGNTYVGGICGVNWGAVEEVSIKDNVKIGTLASTYVGGIAGGNGVDGTIKNCKTYNPLGTATVEIMGVNQTGGIVGINNGKVEKCQLGLEGEGKSRLITIKGRDALGGIVGLNGGNKDYIAGKLPGTGTDKTSITNCNVYGKVSIEATPAPTPNATATRVGGIVGQNGPTNKVTGCNVIGYTSSYTDAATFNYDITLKGTGAVGGIAGANYGDIYGTTTAYNTVTHTAVIASNEYAGGLVGELKSRKNEDAENSAFESKLYYCDVSKGVLIHYYVATSGAFAGRIDGEGATSAQPTLFGTARGGATNKIYMGKTDPVRINAFSQEVSFPLIIGSLPPDANPPTTGNLWAKYLLYNYLYYTPYP